MDEGEHERVTKQAAEEGRAERDEEWAFGVFWVAAVLSGGPIAFVFARG